MTAGCLELGLVRLHQGELASARSLFQESLSFDRDPRMHERIRCLAGLASVELTEGRPDSALRLIGAAEQLQTLRSTLGSRRPQLPVWQASVTRTQVPDPWTGPFDRQVVKSCIAAARAAQSAWPKSRRRARVGAYNGSMPRPPQPLRRRATAQQRPSGMKVGTVDS
jgi:hypothetical protein